MSDMAASPLLGTAFADAARVPVWTRPTARSFTARPSETQGGFAAWVSSDDDADHGFHGSPSNDMADPEALVARGYADGLNEGHRLAMIEMEDERAALRRLASSLECLQPQDGDGLAALLSSTVKRLVTQIVGEVDINAETLAERVHAVAAMIVEETAPQRIRLHPTDLARLDGAAVAVDMVADPLLAPGTIILDTGAGWIEDGPNVRLEKLRLSMDRLGAPR